MKKSIRLAAALLSATHTVNASDLVVHEGGTFTTMTGSDGVALAGLHLEEETLPPFVFRQQFGHRKGIGRVTGVTVKMETPVLYFYAEEKTPVQGEFGEIEHYLFYRGVGNFQTPVITHYDANRILHVLNAGPDTIPFACVYDNEEGDQVRVSWLAALAPGEDRTVRNVNLQGTMQAVETQLRATFVRALTADGLYGDEAEAMLDTWWRSYFQQPGLRVFWIVPRISTDAILPLEIDPQPTELVRVMVGRSEVLSPDFERELMTSYAAEENPHATHRFAPAYQARLKTLPPRP